MKNTKALSLILISIGIFYTFINPQYARTQVLGGEVDRYNNVLDNVEALGETRDELMVKLSRIPSEDLERLAKILPNDMETVRLALDLDSIAGEYGIALQNVQVESRADDTTSVVQDETGMPYEKIGISFSIISNYADFRSFIEDVERSLRIIDIRAISFQVAENGLYEYRVDIETYWLRQ